MKGWWCTKCKQHNHKKAEECTCGASKAKSWRCDRCRSVVVGNMCECGMSLARNMYNNVLVRNLFERKRENGRSNWEVLKGYAYRLAYRRNIPDYLVEDAFGSAMEKIVAKIDTYDPDLGEFPTWAGQIVRNHVLNAAKMDSRASKYLGESLDTEVAGEDSDMLLVETIVGSVLDINTLIEAEERKQFDAMRKIATQAFGKYFTYDEDGPHWPHVYDVAVNTYEDRDGKSWQSITARRTGISLRTMQGRVNRARTLWQKAKAIQHSTSESGGLER